MNAPIHRRALVIGLGASGLAACSLLLEMGVEVHGYDRRTDLAHPPPGVRLFLGAEVPGPDAFAGVDLIVLSPGVPPGPHREACRRFAPEAQIHGELSLALQSIGPLPTVLITGTNGKSTVTALVGHLLAEAGQRPFVGGNLGTPPAQLARALLRGDARPPSMLVLECSSYQLETLPPRPATAAAVAMVLNISPDHLDRYASMEDYAQTKARVFDGLAEDGLALLDAEDDWTDRLASRAGKRLELIGSSFARIEGPGPGTTLHVGGNAYPRELLRLPGRHNAKNALFALAAARALGLDPDRCAAGLRTFAGLPHRMAFVRELHGVQYYNDSKATNVASVLASLGGLSERFVLLAGGRAKGDDLRPLGHLLQRRGRGLVAMGESAQQLMPLADGLPAHIAPTMEDAVLTAARMARRGDMVVLAPACASFDQYRSYAERGERFIQAVRGLDPHSLLERA